MNTILFIGGIGPGELVVVLVLALLLFGGRKIPQLAKDLGVGIREFRKSISDSTRELPEETEANEAPPVARKSDKKKSRV